MNEIQKSIQDKIGEQRLNILKGFSESDSLEKAKQTKYLRKYIENGKWVYVYENPNYNKGNAKLNKVTDEINSLNRKRERLLNMQDSDPNIEVTGGKIADTYGTELNKLDEKIKKLVAQQNEIARTPQHIHEKSNDIVRAWEYPK